MEAVVRSAVLVGTQSRLKSTSRILEERRWRRGLVEPRIGVGCGRVMHDGDPTSSLPRDAAGCMTYRAESKKARNVKTSNTPGDRTAGERGNGAQIYHH